MDKPVCPKCNNFLKFREWSDRLPPKSEALAECLHGHGFWQIRYFQGQPTSEPYQVRKPAEKTVHGGYRIKPARAAAIVAAFGSVQEYLDYGPLFSLPCITQQV